MIEIDGWKIDTDIPVPLRKGEKGPYPFRKLGIGHSFFVEGDKKKVAAVAVAVSVFAKQNKCTFRTQVRTENGKSGIRIWRIVGTKK